METFKNAATSRVVLHNYIYSGQHINELTAMLDTSYPGAIHNMDGYFQIYVVELSQNITIDVINVAHIISQFVTDNYSRIENATLGMLSDPTLLFSLVPVGSTYRLYI